MSATQGGMIVRMPPALARSLHSEGLNRAEVFLGEEGILLKPYAGESKKGGFLELPDWNHE